MFFTPKRSISVYIKTFWEKPSFYPPMEQWKACRQFIQNPAPEFRRIFFIRIKPDDF
jgi:hypothetical protein